MSALKVQIEFPVCKRALIGKEWDSENWIRGVWSDSD